MVSGSSGNKNKINESSPIKIEPFFLQLGKTNFNVSFDYKGDDTVSKISNMDQKEMKECLFRLN